jgi:hypothetical protein
MAKRVKRPIHGGSGRNPGLDGREKRRLEESEPLSIFEQISAIAKRDARLELGEKRNRLFLSNWWCRYYSRPLKDPLLQEYTLEELAYEYYLINEIEKVRQERIEAEADRIELDKLQEADDWADMMEAEEEEEERKAQESKDPKPEPEPEPEQPADPREDPEQIKWMEEQIEKHKLMFGDEDIDVKFEDD